MKLIINHLFTFFLLTTPPLVNAITDTTNLDLTDEERNMVNNYEHQDYHSNAMDDLCNIDQDEDGKHDQTGEDLDAFFADSTIQDACSGKSLNVWGMDSDTMAQVTKAYTTITSMGMMGGGGGGGAAAAGQPANSGGGNNKDYCAMLGMATELVSGFQQEQYQKHVASLPSKAETAQTDALHKNKGLYRQKAANHETQTVGWGATATCYTAKLTSPGGVTSVGNWAKLAAAGVLTFYNNSAIGVNNQMANKLNNLIQKMPKKGDCNPITDTICYCTQPSTKNDAKYCLPQMQAYAKRNYGTTVTCLDKYMRPDPDCGCLSTNSCFDATYMNNINGISFGKTFEEVNGKSMKQIARGILGQDQTLGDGNIGNNAIQKLKRTLSQMDSKVPLPKGLTSSQKADAKNLMDIGLPKNMAIAFAGTPNPSKSALAKARSRFSRNRSKRKYSYNKKPKSRVIRFKSSQQGLDLNHKSKRSRGNNLSHLLNKGKKGRGTSSNILRYAEEARNKASIVQRPDVDIFKIISNRYRLSKNRLE